MFDIVILSKDKLFIDFAKTLGPNDYKEDIDCDILVVLSNLDPINFKISTNIAIVYGDLGFKSYHNIRYRKIITYGMSNKNTATISSFLDNEILVSTLREFSSINKKRIELSEYLFEKENLTELDTLALGVLSIVME